MKLLMEVGIMEHLKLSHISLETLNCNYSSHDVLSRHLLPHWKIPWLRFYVTCEWHTPSANAVFFNGDQGKGTGNPVIERLSDLERITEILVSKFGSSVNAWVIEASTFNAPFAVSKDFIRSVNIWGEPKSYNPTGFLASTSTVNLLSNCLKEEDRKNHTKLQYLHHVHINPNVYPWI
ncbi:uncharacterized protein LOC130777803 [Actinidia eriantha]|uniref:uncharacterized protein LOC130777803 n=1 Tax=Actinidia eriantha TaxID=165200 RepID=UPI00258D5250|nr:uncharacterized protein LOC130777803 [Actinidia eriantha]